MVCRLVLALVVIVWVAPCNAEGLGPNRLGVIYNINDATSTRVALYYAARRHIPSANVIGLPVADRAVISRDDLLKLRTELLAKLPSEVQSLLLVWARPYAVECMAITTAVAAGFRSEFCEPGCSRTALNPLFDTTGWLPADTAGWLPAMLLPTQDETLARAVIERGIAADNSHPRETAYLVHTQDSARNVRAASYSDAENLIAGRIAVREITTPINQPVKNIVAYFTGVARVTELSSLKFLPGAVADHLTSVGGVLDGSSQMSAIEWLRQGATASYGSVSEPCAFTGKFPNPAVFLDHYLKGDTMLEAYWKSVAMPGQGLFIGEPLARPFSSR